MNRSQAEEQIRKGITLSDNIMLRKGKGKKALDVELQCVGLTVKIETGEAFMVYELPVTQRQAKEVTAKSKKGAK